MKNTAETVTGLILWLQLRYRNIFWRGGKSKRVYRVYQSFNSHNSGNLAMRILSWCHGKNSSSRGKVMLSKEHTRTWREGSTQIRRRHELWRRDVNINDGFHGDIIVAINKAKRLIHDSSSSDEIHNILHFWYSGLGMVWVQSIATHSEGRGDKTNK